MNNEICYDLLRTARTSDVKVDRNTYIEELIVPIYAIAAKCTLAQPEELRSFLTFIHAFTPRISRLLNNPANDPFAMLAKVSLANDLFLIEHETAQDVSEQIRSIGTRPHITRQPLEDYEDCIGCSIQ